MIPARTRRAVNSFLTAAGKCRLHSMASFVAVWGTCKYHVYTSNRNVPLSETAVRMGHSSVTDRLVGLVVRRPPRERKIPGLNPACAGIFSGSSHTSDLKFGTPVATMPGAWRYRVSAGNGWPGDSIL